MDLSLELAVHPRPSYAPESRDLGIRHGHRGEEELMVDEISVSLPCMKCELMEYLVVVVHVLAEVHLGLDACANRLVVVPHDIPE